MPQKEVEVFKTNIVQEEDGIRMIELFHKMYPMYKINFDLDDCDKILRVEGENVEHKKIIELINTNGYECKVLE